MMKYIPITPEKLEDLIALSVETYSRDMFICGEMTDREQGRASTMEEIEHFMPNGLDTPNMEIYSVEDKGVDVGYLWYNIRVEEHNHAFLTYIHVNPELRGKGYAKKMMAHFQKESRSKYNAVDIKLVVFKHNKPAVNLYHRCGYMIADELTFYNATVPKRYMMVKLLL